MFFLALGGCATSSYSKQDPAHLDPDNLFLIHGSIQFSGNRDYLPRSIKASENGNGPAIKYEYFVHYASEGESNLAVFNPLLILGAKKTTDAVLVAGRLTITREDGKNFVLNESLSVSKDTALFSEGDTYSEMRKQGLLRVRNLIDNKIVQKKPELQAFLQIPEKENN